MRTNNDPNEHLKLSLARLRQIEFALQEAERQEEEALNAEQGTGPTADLMRLAKQDGFMRTRLALMNERAQIAMDLVCVTTSNFPDVTDDELVELAERLDLSEVLLKERQSGAVEKRCLTNCVECISSCGLNYCASSCTECVINPNGCPPGFATECVPINSVSS